MNAYPSNKNSGMGGSLAIQDGVIDLESENLTYAQAKSIRN